MATTNLSCYRAMGLLPCQGLHLTTLLDLVPRSFTILSSSALNAASFWVLARRVSSELEHTSKSKLTVEKTLELW